MRILVLQHSSVEDAGLFEDFAKEDGHDVCAIRADQVGQFPDPSEFDALWVMGGAMDVWEEDKYPWLKAEKAFIREAVFDRGLPYLGFCLGHQLLADALDGTVGPAEINEIGPGQVQLTEVGASGVLFDGFPEKFDMLQWHGAEVKTIPAGAQILATSPDCVVQAMKWETRAASVQFHLEAGPDVFSKWFAEPDYQTALVNAVGQERADEIVAGHRANRQAADLAERFYINWLQMTSRA